MSDLFGNHIVGFSTRWLILFHELISQNRVKFSFLLKAIAPDKAVMDSQRSEKP